MKRDRGGHAVKAAVWSLFPAVHSGLDGFASDEKGTLQG
jgi:hypothetical protein